MSIYNQRCNNASYYNLSLSLENCIVDNDIFLRSLDINKKIVNESFKDKFITFKERFKEIITTIIEFLGSIPRRVKELMSRFFNRNKKIEKEIETKKKDPEYIFDSNREYEEDVYNYTNLVGTMFNRSNIMMSEDPGEYKSFLIGGIQGSVEEFENNFGRKINPSFGHCKTKESFVEYINSDEYIDKFKYQSQTSGDLNKIATTLDPVNLDWIIEKATKYRDSWQRIEKNVDNMLKDDNNLTGDLLKTLSNNKTSEDKIKEAGLEEDALKAYLKFANLSAFACQTVITQALKYSIKAEEQYVKINNFLSSCYKKKEE